MKQIKATFYSVFLALFVSGNASASDNSNVVISNMEGLVVKNFSCDTIYDILDFNVSNRNNSSVDGDLTPHHALGMRPPMPETLLEKSKISGTEIGG